MLINRYSDSLPGIAEPGSFGYDGGVVAALAYGTATILVVLFEPGGLVALGARLRRHLPSHAPVPHAPLVNDDTALKENA